MARLSRPQLLTRCSGAGFTSLRRELGWLPPHLAAAAAPPDPQALSERERRQWLMLTAQLYCFAEAWRLRHRTPVAAP